MRVELFVNSPGFSLTPSSPQRFDGKQQTQPAFYPSPAGGAVSPDLLVSCVLSETSLHFLKITAQMSTAAITFSFSQSPQQICCEWASGAVLSVSGALTEHCQSFLSERGFFFCLTSTYLLTFAWKVSIGLWRSIVLVFSSERSSARSAGCVCAEKCTGIKKWGSRFIMELKTRFLNHFSVQKSTSQS